MRVTIKDIAETAKVSPSTVSRILAGKTDNYASKTVKRVCRIAVQMGYQKNTAARELVTRKSNVLAVIVSETRTNFSEEIIQGIHQVALDKNLSVMIVYAGESDQGRQHRAIKTVIERGVRAILLLAIVPGEDNTRLLHASHIPFIFLATALGRKDLPFISSNDFDIGYQATDYLLKRGHVKIGFAGLNLGTYVGDLRFQGYQYAFQKAGLDWQNEWIKSGRWSYQDGIRAMKAWGRGTELTAIIGASDLVAIGVMNTALDLGMAVPDQLSVLGIDGTSLCHIVRPELTAIRQAFYEMGRRGVQRLMDHAGIESAFTSIDILPGGSVTAPRS
ncbi:LacI family DNA-binding transcriptional regulator [Sporolactobacillus sp. THM19-2]|uniref:LacI family DNA-binding transcriptional regulator n=1 Tax=Sporolactobacillus sp. THM19-2 TaxID=2511171 RepID=UPI0010204FD1|nr:LacI family DNA-binding transcriptional regulator [Sporolactobacillus sp. THM19-2]RYL87561.1 LacI family transcriptional regulator [Sporolactobacillus sp. THM19-2]